MGRILNIVGSFQFEPLFQGVVRFYLLSAWKL